MGTKRERRNGLKRQSKTSVRSGMCKSHQAGSEFTEQHAHHNLCKCLFAQAEKPWMGSFL